MEQLPKTHSPVVSNYRPAYSIETLERIHRVTGQEFPISGNAWLRYQLRGLKARLNAEYAKHARQGEGQ